MIWHSPAGQADRLSVSLAILVSLLAVAQPMAGQGCMPLHFAFPGLTGQQVSYFQAHDWQIGVAFRRVASNRFFVGSEENEAAAPGGQPLNIRSYSIDLSGTYAFSDRFSLTLTIPLAYNRIENVHPDGLRHPGFSSGVGDINLFGNLWVADPGTHLNANLSLGLGVKAAVGRYHDTQPFYVAPGSSVPGYLPQTTQLGDGGWAILLQAQAFHQVFSRASAYFSGIYSVSLKQNTDVPWPPAGNALWAVPDIYSARLGLGYLVKADPGLSLSLGGRIDGTTTRDLVGGRTDYYRHAGYTVFVEPGVTLQLGPSQFVLNVPVRVHHNYLSMTLSDGTVRPGAGGVGDYVVYAGYTWRF